MAKSKIDPASIRRILATDCGSTTTKAILIQKVDGEYRQTHRGEAPTTVEAPVEDVTNGVRNSIRELEELSGIKMLTEEGNILKDFSETTGAIFMYQHHRLVVVCKWSFLVL